ncbi:hypothetical protein ACLMJK_003662 [Lecanora helva]
MEHLPCFKESERVDIPYLGTEEYDNGDFLTYPERQNWDKKKIFRERDFSGKDPVEVEAFFQTWLYFGLLICVFRVVGVKVKTTDFLRTENGKTFVSTERLPEYLLDWTNRENIALIRFRGRDPSEAIQRNGKTTQWPVIREMLAEVHQYVNRYCNEQGQRWSKEMHLGDKFFVQPISPEVSLSIIATANALSRAATTIYGVSFADLRLNWGTSALLTERLSAKRLCPKDISWLTYEKDRNIDLQYAVTCNPYSRAGVDHTECTELVCCQDRVDLGTYSTRHVDAQCNCTMMGVPQEFLSIIEEGEIPIVTFRGGPDGCRRELRVTRHQPNARYVAISHVKDRDFAHGGYRYRKTIDPNLRWDELYQAVEAETNDPSYTPAGFWIDTLCVPVQNQRSREMAIRNMTDVYRKADRVLVLDSWIYNTSREDHINDRSMRILMSNWQRRLWTLQERVLATDLFFQYRDGPQHRDDLIIDMRLYVHFDRGFYHQIAVEGLVGLVSLQDVLETQDDEYSAFDMLTISLKHRSTTRSADETICFGTMLGLDVMPLQNISSKSPDLRMAKFYRIVGKFRSHRIFDPGPRCPIEGFGWARATFLNQTKYDAPSDYEGALVTNSHLHSNGGLIASYSGIRLGRAGASLVPKLMIAFPEDHTKGLLCGFRESEVGQGIPSWDPSEEYALISCVPIPDMFDNPSIQSIAIIGILQDNADFDGLQLKYVCRATLRKSDLEDCDHYWSGKHTNKWDDTIIEGQLVESGQQWCVV